MVLARSLAKLKNRALAAAYASWLDLVELRKFARRFLQAMVGRWQNAELAGSMNSWRAYVHQCKEAESMAEGLG